MVVDVVVVVGVVVVVVVVVVVMICVVVVVVVILLLCLRMLDVMCTLNQRARVADHNSSCVLELPSEGRDEG